MPCDNALISSFDKGAAANRRGDPIANNPHMPSGDRYHAWNEGWWWEEGPKYRRSRDSDRSGEAMETGTGSTEGESAGPKDIAQQQDLS